MSHVTGSFGSSRHVSVVVFPCMAASVRVNVEESARVAGGTGVSVLMEGALCLAISEMRNETKIFKPYFLQCVVVFSML